MSKLRMVRAYLGAVITGLMVFALIMLPIFLLPLMTSSETKFSTDAFLNGSVGSFILILMFIGYGLPVSLITAAPFTLICTSLIGIAWNATHRNSIILGALCPLVSTAFFTMLFIMPTTSPPDPESNRFNDYILPALVVGVALIPSGAVAGSVFWRLGLRPKASPSKSALQVKS
ncbi:hypothetical protein ACQZ6A_19010 [Agrobacterium vitis]